MKLLVILLVSGFWFLVIASPARAQSTIWYGNCTGDIHSDAWDVATLQGIECLVSNVLSVALRLIGIAMFIMLIFGGIRYLTSGGDPKATEGAQKTITLAITGMVLAILSWFILVLIGQFTGVDLTTFTFPDLN